MPSGPVTQYLDSWSSANMISATINPRRRSAIHDFLAAVIEATVAIHIRQVAPATSAFVVLGLRHLDLIAPMNCRGDEQLGEQPRILAARHPDFRLEAGSDDLVAAQRLDRLGDLGAERTELGPARVIATDRRDFRPFEQMHRPRVGKAR